MHAYRTSNKRVAGMIILSSPAAVTRHRVRTAGRESELFPGASERGAMRRPAQPLSVCSGGAGLQPAWTWLVAAAATAAATTAPAPAAAPAAATGKSTIRLRTGFIDVQRSAVELPAIQFRDSAIRFRVCGHFDKSEPSGLAGIPVGDDVDALDGAIRFKQRSNRSFGSPEVEVAYKNILHLAFSFVNLRC